MHASEIRIEDRPSGRRLRCYAERPTRGLWAMLEHQARTRPDAEALVLGERLVSYAQFAVEVERTAASLYHRFGVRPGARVGMLLGNCLEFAFVFYACQRLGAIAMPLGTRNAGPELAYMLAHAGAKVLVGEPHLLERVQGAELPELAHWLTPDALDHVAPAAPDVHIGEDDIACILYTSGTTGRPKGATLTHFNFTHTVLHYQHGLGLGAEERTLVAVPLFHVTGLAAQLLLMVHLGGCSVILAEFKADRFLDALEKERITHTVVVPSIYVLCLRNPRAEGMTLPHWRVAGYGGAPMPESCVTELAQRFPGLRMHNIYGATETCSPTTLNPADRALSHSSSVGQALPCAELRVVDEQGRDVAPGASGELLIKGPMVVPGYWDNPEANRSSFVDGGYWRSGDMASIDAEGQVRILDRKKDMLSRGGYKVYCVEVENVLYQHPAVLEAAVIGVPDAVLGERVKTVLVPRAGAELQREELRAFCAERLADYKVPELVDVVASLPRNPAGKVMKHLLREAAPS
ncbi:MAG: AMP-binding protein [Myxococcaceae bacterium]|nr:AMP-binding protein [Myxococcaceae bacterium]